jgi:hypothetical protein
MEPVVLSDEDLERIDELGQTALVRPVRAGVRHPHQLNGQPQRWR